MNEPSKDGKGVRLAGPPIAGHYVRHPPGLGAYPLVTFYEVDMAKGGAWEREIAVQLSEWWTDGDRSDVFWRSSNSGGRATARAKQGKPTAGSYGDIAAIDPIGKPLIDAFTFSLKRGYNSHSIHALLDAPKGAKVQAYQEWIDKAHEDYIRAGSLSWALLTRRDRRETLLFLPEWVFSKFWIRPIARFQIETSGQEFAVGAYRWTDWVSRATPQDIRDLVGGV